MEIHKRTAHPGIDIHLEPDECDLFVKLSIDAETLEGERHTAAEGGDGRNYFTFSVALGKRIRALRDVPANH